jgi:TonB family protein
LVRERADLRDSKEEYQRDVQVADEWVQKALEAKRVKARTIGEGVSPVLLEPSQLRVGNKAQSANRVHLVAPLYPPEAKEARIVRMQVVIGVNGLVESVQLVSGHPLLAPAAVDAVRQWTYHPTYLNGRPVQVTTQVEVNFTLDN